MSEKEPMIEVANPQEFTPVDLEILAEYLKTGRMLIPTQEISREELKRMYPEK